MLTLSINGEQHTLDVEPDTPLLWALRDAAGLTGTKYGCGAALCGACTVHIDGKAARACATPVEAAVGAEIVTIEGMAARPNQPVVAAWIAHDVPQCGYCQPGQIMTACALLSENAAPSDADIDRAMNNICRCGCYADIRAAVHTAAAALRKGAPL
jgi:isoquinoline 1-oxidoreductase alpha subunit